MGGSGSKECVDGSGDSKPYHAVHQEIQEVTSDYVPGGGGFTDHDHKKCGKHCRDNGHHGRFLRRNQELDDISTEKWSKELMGMMPKIKRVDDKTDALVKGYLSDYIQISLPLVGKFEGHHVSIDRPDSFQDSPYVLRDSRGKDVGSFGSGYILYIEGPFTDGESGDINWKVTVRTATHVVYDQKETNVAKFLLEDEFGKEDTIKLEYGEIKHNDTKKDFCRIVYTIKDQSLATRIQQTLDLIEKKRKDIKQIIEANNISLDDLPLILISHPHGRGKYVTCGVMKGRWGTHRHGRVSDYPSCPGSSGGMVMGGRWRWFNTYYGNSTHSHAKDKGEKRDVSRTADDYGDFQASLGARVFNKLLSVFH